MNIQFPIDDKNLQQIFAACNPKDIVISLSFANVLKLAYLLLYNDSWEQDKQLFAIRILEELRKANSYEWKSSWRNDAFLGNAYNIILDYDNKYKAFKRAMNTAKIPPPELLIAFADCCDSPGKPPLTYDQAINYLKIALKEYLYVDGVALLKKIYWLKDDFDNEKHWGNILNEIKDFNNYSPSLETEVSK